MSVDTKRELKELSALQARIPETEAEVRRRVWKLRRLGVSLRDLSKAVGLSESQVSRLANKPKLPDTGRPALTAMELVRLAQRGGIDHASFIDWLKKWPYEPMYKTAGLADDVAEFRDNSWDAVEAAYFRDVISDEEYEQILVAVRARGVELR